jgi:hypothetical protein
MFQSISPPVNQPNSRSERCSNPFSDSFLRLSKVRMGGELVPWQVNKTAPRGLLWALYTTEDPLWRILQ